MHKPRQLNQEFFEARRNPPLKDDFNILMSEYNNLVEVVNYLYNELLRHQKGLDEECLELLNDRD